MSNKFDSAFYDLKNYADVGGSYLPCPLVAADNTILDL